MAEHKQKTTDTPEDGRIDLKADNASSAVPKHAAKHASVKSAQDDESTSKADGTEASSKLSEPKKPSKPSKLKQPKIIVLIIVIVVALVAAITGISYLVIQDMEAKAETQRRAEQAAIIHVEPDMVNEIKVENPIDWASWQGRNEDVHAWIIYPGTAINHPILQDQSDDEFYLYQSIDREYSLYGELFTQRANALDWSDPATVIYGHTFPNTEVMFTDLHHLDDAQFMADNPYIYVYTPNKAFTYEVISVAETDNHDVMNAYACKSPIDRQAYFDSIINPRWEWAYVKPGATLDASKDKIIQLSTCCIPSDGEKRYIVTGKLVNEQKTL